MAKNVKVIPVTKGSGCTLKKRKIRVCAYVRVSTGNTAQRESYMEQVEYFTRKIKGNPEWEFAGVYADEAVSGTSLSGREEFDVMIEECMEGNIDLILTKSVTRFARNTLESLMTIRKLKAAGIGVFFESLNIHTLKERSELLITALSAVAQWESEDYSGNNRWAIVKRFQDGSFIISTPAYGYTKDKGRNLVPDLKEAMVVRWIYEFYLSGMGSYEIACEMNAREVATARGGKWSESEIRGILTNPVYVGDLLLQKTYTEINGSYRSKINKGQVDQYLISDNHPAIVTRKEAQAVKDLMRYRVDILKQSAEKCLNRYALSGKIICEECGNHFRRQKAYVGKPYEKVTWVCSKHLRNIGECRMKAIREDVLQNAFITMWNKLYTNQGEILEPLLRELCEMVESQQESEAVEELNKEINDLNEQRLILSQVMRKGYMDSALFYEKNNDIGLRLLDCKRRKALLHSKRPGIKEIASTERLIRLLQDEGGLLEEFRDDLFNLMVKEIHITKEREIVFCLQNGLTFIEKEGGKADAVAYSNRI